MAMHSINGTELHVETVGSGPPILMLHGGLGLDHTYFRPFFDQLADSHTVVYYDHRGNGRSARPSDWAAELTFDNLVADAVGVLDALGLSEATVLGHSYGGFIAQPLAATHPDRISRLVLASTVPAFDYAPEPSGSDEALAAFGALFSGPTTDDEHWRSLWGSAAPLYHHRWDADAVTRIDGTTVYSGAAWNAAAGLLGEFNMLEQLPAIDIPTLCISGRHDFITPPASGSERIAALMPQAEAAILENSGHYPFYEEEEAFFARLRAFLA